MLEEFFQQGDMERAQGLPVSPLMDRTTTAFAPSQINFIEFVVAPLFLQVRLWECAGTATQWFYPRLFYVACLQHCALSNPMQERCIVSLSLHV